MPIHSSRSPSAGRPRRGRPARTDQGRLTARELEIVALVARGLRNQEIGEQLAIREGTVKVHLHSAFRKLGVRNRLALVRAAEARDWI